VRLNQNHLVAAVIVQQANEPVVEATNLQHGHEGLVLPQALAGELLEERVDLLRLRRYLLRLHDVAGCVAEGDRQLPCVLIDSEVQHGWFSCWVRRFATSPYRMGEPLLLDERHSFIDITALYTLTRSCAGEADRSAQDTISRRCNYGFFVRCNAVMASRVCLKPGVPRARASSNTRAS